MNRKSILCAFFNVLLISPAPILAETLEDTRWSFRNKRQAQTFLPLANYTGTTVSAPLFAALVAYYGMYVVTRYAIKKAETSDRTGDKDSHSCANNRGWCRFKCFSFEHIDWTYTAAVCGSYVCCRLGRG